MDVLVWLGIVAVALGALYFAALQAITICVLAIERGKIRVVRGGVAPAILADLRDIARTPPIAQLQVRIVRSSGRAEVRLRGDVSVPQAQRIRNVVGSVPLARLRNAG